MSSSDSDWSRFCGLTKELQEKILLLHQTKNQAEALEKRLWELRKKQMDLENELVPLLRTSKIRNPHQLDFTPIHRCPDEIVFLIFEQYRSISKHDRLLRLLLVCKRWSRIAMDARLWTLIEIDDYDLLDYHGVKARLPYISTCLSRSRGLELDIDWRLYDFPDRERYIMDSIEHYIESITNLSPKYIRKRIAEHDWDVRSPRWEDQVKNAFDCVFGDKRQHVKRWRSLYIGLPSQGRPLRLLWRRLEGDYPCLTSLHFDAFPFEWEKDGLIKRRLSLLHFPKVQSLKVGKGIMACPPTYFNLKTEVIESFDLAIDTGLSYITDLSIFINLRNLRLDRSHRGTSVAFMAQTSSSCLSLPNLAILRLCGERFLFRDLILDVPSLQILKLERFLGLNKLPRMSPRHISWTPEYGSGRLDLDLDLIGRRQIRRIILLSSRLESLTVGKRMKNRVLREVAYMKERGEIETLIHVFTIGTPRKKKRINVEDLRLENLASVLDRKGGRGSEEEWERDVEISSQDDSEEGGSSEESEENDLEDSSDEESDLEEDSSDEDNGSDEED